VAEDGNHRNGYSAKTVLGEAGPVLQPPVAKNNYCGQTSRNSLRSIQPEAPAARMRK
jgi:hypothetical protein